MNIYFENNVFDLENSAQNKSLQFMNNVRKFCTKLSQLQNTNNLPNLKYIKTTSNKFPQKILTAISHTNNMENSKLNKIIKQQDNFNLTKIVSNQYPILIIIILEYKTLSARPSSGATCQNWQKTEG